MGEGNKDRTRRSSFAKLPDGGELKEGSHFYCRVLRDWSQRPLIATLSQHPAKLLVPAAIQNAFPGWSVREAVLSKEILSDGSRSRLWRIEAYPKATSRTF